MLPNGYEGQDGRRAISKHHPSQGPYDTDMDIFSLGSDDVSTTQKWGYLGRYAAIQNAHVELAP